MQILKVWNRLEKAPAGIYLVEKLRKEVSDEAFVEAIKAWIDCKMRPTIDFNSDFTKFQVIRFQAPQNPTLF